MLESKDFTETKKVPLMRLYLNDQWIKKNDHWIKKESNARPTELTWHVPVRGFSNWPLSMHHLDDRIKTNDLKV